MTLFLIRYGEIGLKSSPVRNRFERILISNISTMFAKAGVECVFNTDWGHVYVETSSAKKASTILRNVFGIVSFSDVLVCSSDMDEIRREVVNYSEKVLMKGVSFALNVRRKGDHPYTSIQLAQTVGRDVLKAHGGKSVRVDLTDPNKEIFIEVRDNKTYIYNRKVQGLGGMPVGSQGNVLVLVENARSIVSAFLMMKRGCKVFLLVPKQMRTDKSLRKFVETLKKFDPNLTILLQSITDDIEGISAISKKEGIDALVLGSSLDSTNSYQHFKKLNIPILYPLVGLDDEEIERLKRRICAKN